MRKIIIVVISMSLVISLLLMGCFEKEDIKVGFTVGLSGNFANEGVFARNGYYLAIEEINASGGIDGHMLKAVVKDDASNVDVAKKVDQAFYDEGVQLIIGHLISSTTPAVIEGMEKYNHLYISPTMSTAELSNINDNFYRVIGDSHMMAKGIYDIIKEDPIDHSIMIVQDLGNRAFTEVIKNDLIDAFLKDGISFTGVYELSENDNYEDLAKKIQTSQSNGLVLLASSTTSAEIIQHINVAELSPSIYVSTWALSAELILNGGKGTDGVYGVAFYDEKNLGEKQMIFYNNYVNRFNTEPSSTSMFAYDAVYLLKEALEQADSFKADDVKKALDSLGSFEGLTESFEINPYGDAIRPYVKIQIINGQMESID